MKVFIKIVINYGKNRVNVIIYQGIMYERKGYSAPVISLDSRKVKKIATWIVVPLMAAIFILDIITVALCNTYCKRYEIKQEDFSYESGDDRIYFLNTANSDSMLLESNGHFALIDAGEGNSNPRRKTEYKGYEKETTQFIINAAGKGKKAKLDFVLATHYHYDHIGAFHAIATNENIEIEKAYFKNFDAVMDKKYEISKWKIDETYAQIIEDFKSRGVEVVSDLPETAFKFGDFTVEFYNTVNDRSLAGKGENSCSVGVKITKGEKSAFLAGDITSESGLEKKLRDKIGDIDLLKVGHHGYYGSSSMSFLKVLKPEVCIVTNILGKVYPNVKWNLTMFAHCPFYATYDRNGIAVTFTDAGELVLTENIHEAAENAYK